MLYSPYLAAGLLSSVSFVGHASPAPPKPLASAKIFSENFPSIGVRIGNSNDILYLALDTGSALAWVNPSKIKHPSKSQVSRQQFSISYGTGSVKGHVATDELHVGLNNQLDLKLGRQFGTADINVSPELSDWGGVLGGWDMLIPVLTPRIFGLRMQHSRNGQVVSVADADVVGQIDWGAPDPKYVSQGITYANVPADKTTSALFINIHGTHLNGQPTGLGTGSTGINLFAADAKKINTILGGKPIPGKANAWALPCNINNAKVALEIDIGGTLFGIPNYLLVNGQTSFDPNLCDSWVQGTATDTWTLGSGFLQAVYSVWDFDAKRVGFAKVPPIPDPPSPSSTAHPPPPRPLLKAPTSGSPGAADLAVEEAANKPRPTSTVTKTGGIVTKTITRTVPAPSK